MTTLFVTATGQTQANSNMIWHLFKANKADIERIVIISTDFSKRRRFVEKLKNWLNMALSEFKYFKVDELHLPNSIEERSVVEIKNHLLQWINDNNVQNVIFSVTGGTSLISIAQDQLSQTLNNAQCVYQSRQLNHLVWYNPFGQRTEQLVLPEKIEYFLEGEGYKQKSTSPLLERNVREANYVYKLLGLMRVNFKKARDLALLLNTLTAQVPNNQEQFPYTVKLDNKANAWFDKHVNWLTDLANIEQPYFNIDKKNRKLIVNSANDVNFLSGQWFEILVGILIAEYFYQQKIQLDVQIGLEFQKSSDGNEVDVAYLHNGYFNMFECKTVNWKNKDKPTNEVNTALHKLTSISEVGALNQHKYFVSLFNVSDESKRVAKDKDITIIAGKQILDLASYLIVD